MGTAPDQGAFESIYVSGTNYVHNITQDTWFTNISSAVADASNDDVIEVYAKPGGFSDSVRIADLTNVEIRSVAWESSGDNTGTIINASDYSNAINITNSRYITIKGFTLLKGRRKPAAPGGRGRSGAAGT